MGKKLLKKNMLLLLWGFLCLGSLCAQGNGGAEPENPETRITLPAPPAAGEAGAALPAAQTGAFPLVRMLIVLALIAGAAFGLTKFFKRGLTSGYTSDPYLKRAASLTLAPGKTVHVITLDETAFVVGVTESAVTPIGQVQNKDLVDALNLHAEESAPPQNRRSFADLLGALTGRGGRNQRGESGAFEDTARAIREQKDRISRVQGGEG